jgi:nucleoside-diphosphate-sugar epimerase
MNILLTGSTGFIGKRLVKSLAANGHTIGLLIRSGSIARAKKMFQNIPQVHFIEADISAVDYLVSRQSKEGVSIMGVSGRDAHIDATFTFEVKFMSFSFST